MNNETIDDILTEIREYDNTPPPKRAWLDLADRIAAAVRREREAAEARQLNECVVVREEEASEWRKRIGNVAALRAALELCVREMCAYCRAEAATTMPGKECLYGCEALRIAKAALSAPPRNCDRFVDGDTASNTYEAEGGERDYLEFARWLFAPAEGGQK